MDSNTGFWLFQKLIPDEDKCRLLELESTVTYGSSEPNESKVFHVGNLPTPQSPTPRFELDEAHSDQGVLEDESSSRQSPCEVPEPWSSEQAVGFPCQPMTESTELLEEDLSSEVSLEDLPDRRPTWVDNVGLVWVNGKPGSGKSALMKKTYEQTAALTKSSKKTVVVLNFFFDGQGGPAQSSSTGLFRTLLRQLLMKLPRNHTITACIMSKYKEMKRMQSEIDWSIDDLKEVFFKVCSLSEPIHIMIFIDALDEMLGTSSDFRDVLNFLDQCARSEGITKVSICFSSRPETQIESWVQHRHCLQYYVQWENELDIKKFVHSRITALQQIRRHETALELLAEEIVRRADGVFLWVALVMKEVTEIGASATRAELQNLLRKIPNELSSFYESKIRDIDDKSKAEVLRILTLEIFVERCMFVRDYRIAFAVTRGKAYRTHKEIRRRS